MPNIVWRKEEFQVNIEFPALKENSHPSDTAKLFHIKNEKERKFCGKSCVVEMGMISELR